MSWPPVPRNEDKGLTRYVDDGIANKFPIPIERQGTLAKPDGRRLVIEAIYNALCERNISYAIEPCDPDPRVQQIRSHELVLNGAREGTCLDLALLFAAIALGKCLAPLIVMLEGHALVAVSLDDDRSTAKEMPRRSREGAWLEEGLLHDGSILRKLIDEGHYIAVECTGFAKGTVFDPSMPESADRVGGKLAFGSALFAGRKQLDCEKDRPFRFAIDLAVLRDKHAYVYAFGLPDALLGESQREMGIARRFQAQTRAFTEEYLGSEKKPVPFGGRDIELRRLDDWLRDPNAPSRMLITSPAGRGKSALLVQWMKTLQERGVSGPSEWQIAFMPISIRHGTNRPDVFYEGIARRLAEIVGEFLPSDATRGSEVFRYAARDLLTRIAGSNQRLVLIIDGLDEALHGRFDSAIIPEDLPASVKIVLSARWQLGDTSSQGWLNRLGWDSGVEFEHFELGTLNADGIEDVLVKLGAPVDILVRQPGLIDKLSALTEGEPLLI